MLLSRSVGIKLERVDDSGNLLAHIFHPAGDIAYEVLKNGFARLNSPKQTEYDADYYRKLKEA